MSQEVESSFATGPNRTSSDRNAMRKQSPGAISYSSGLQAKMGLFETDLLSGNFLSNSVMGLAKENSKMINTIIALQREREVLKARLVVADAIKADAALHNENSHTTVDTETSGQGCARIAILTEDLLREIQGAIQCKARVSGRIYNGMQVVFHSMEKQAVDVGIFDRDKKIRRQLMGLLQSISRSADGNSPSGGCAAGASGETLVSVHRVLAPATERVDQFAGFCMDLLSALYDAHARRHWSA